MGKQLDDGLFIGYEEEAWHGTGALPQHAVNVDMKSGDIHWNGY